MLVGWKFFEMVNVSTSCQVASGLHVVGIEWFRFHALHLNTEQEGEEQWGIVLTMNGGRRWGLSFLNRGVKGGSDVPPRLQKSVKAVCDWFVIGAYVPFLLIK